MKYHIHSDSNHWPALQVSTPDPWRVGGNQRGRVQTEGSSSTGDAMKLLIYEKACQKWVGDQPGIR